MRSLARAFAIRIQNISTIRRCWRATNVGLYCILEQQKLKRVCAVSLHSKHLEDADRKSTSFFFLQKLRRLRICAGWAESLSYSVHLIDLGTQLTLVFIAYASSRSSDECVHMCSLARAFSTCVWNIITFRKSSRPNMYAKYGLRCEKAWFCCMRTTKAQTSLHIILGNPGVTHSVTLHSLTIGVKRNASTLGKRGCLRIWSASLIFTLWKL